jgi:hypothetical protein
MLTTHHLPPAKLPAKRTLQTPFAYAKSWAKTNSAYTGVLNVTSYQPAGKGGYKDKRKTTPFYIVTGRAALAVEKRDLLATPSPTRRTYKNGQCECCGQIHLDPVLTVYIDHTESWIIACPVCAAQNHLTQTDSERVCRLTRFTRRPHSPLAHHTAFYACEVYPQHTFSITQSPNYPMTISLSPTSEPPASIAAIFRAYRQQHALTVRACGEELGTSANQISRYENGLDEPSYKRSSDWSMDDRERVHQLGDAILNYRIQSFQRTRDLRASISPQ